MFSTRSTSPLKSAWPGVSMMLIFTPPYVTAVFFARIVIPFSRSSSLLSMIRLPTSWFSRKMWLCFSSASTSVVFPWSTWAMMAMFLMLRNMVLCVGNEKRRMCLCTLVKRQGVGASGFARTSRKDAGHGYYHAGNPAPCPCSSFRGRAAPMRSFCEWNSGPGLQARDDPVPSALAPGFARE